MPNFSDLAVFTNVFKLNIPAMKLIPLLLLSVFCLGDAYKILVYNSKYGHSHSNFLGMIADTLVGAGHNVTSLIPIMDPKVKDGTEKSTIIYVEADKEVLKEQEEEHDFNLFDFNNFNPIIPLFMGPMMSTSYSLTCQKVLAEPGLMEKLKSEKFDVYIAENFDVCGTALAHAIAPKSFIAAMSSSLSGEHFHEFGVPQALSYRPAPYMSSMNVHSLYDRALNVYADVLFKGCFWYMRWVINGIMKQHYGPEYPSIAEQSSKAAYVFTNSEPLLDYAAPTLTRVVDIPGIGAKTPKPLDEYWTEIMNRRERTILLSFGSLVQSSKMDLDMKMAILQTMKNLKEITFIWKYEEPEDEFSKNEASKIENLVMTKWMPQVDILAHPKLAVFITHGGMGSTQETALRGVPGIFIPVFGDQPRNAGMMEYNGFGKVFDKTELNNADKLTAVIKEVLENEKYHKNAKKISKMLAKKPFSSKQQLVKTVEFAAEFGPSPALRPQSHDMSFITYHNLDLIFVFLILFAVFSYLSFKISAMIIRKLFGSKKTKKE